MGAALGCGDSEDVGTNAAASPMDRSNNMSNFQNWANLLKQFEYKIKSMNTKCGNIGEEAWVFLLSKFKGLYLNVQEKNEFVDYLLKLIKYSLKQINPANCFVYVSDISKKLGYLENRIHFKQKYALSQIKYLVHQPTPQTKSFLTLKFDMSQEEVLNVTKQVRALYTNDERTFAILSLYFRISVQKRLKKNSYKKVQEDYLSMLTLLEKKYPASSEPLDLSKVSSKLESQKHQTKLPIFQFKKLQNKKNIQQLIELILTKAEHAKSNLDSFSKLCRQICYESGYGFKSGVKIRNKENKQSINRTIQKILRKNKNEVKLKKIQQNASKNIDKDKVYSFEQLTQLVAGEINSVQESIQQILEEENEIQIDAKDLLRGKCNFNQPQDLIITTKKYLQKIKENKFEIIEVDNRLGKKTNDITVISKFNDSISELQLVLKLDKAANQFNHKIYELKRSQLYSPITNLFVLNRKWCRQYFIPFIDIVDQNIKIKSKQDPDLKISFFSLKQEVNRLKDEILEAYGVEYHVDQHFKEEEKTTIKRCSEDLFKQFQSQQTIKSLQLVTQVHQKTVCLQILFSYPDYKEAVRFCNEIKDENIKNCTNILTLKADALKNLGLYNQSKQVYKILAGDIQNTKSIQAAGAINKLAMVEKQNGNYTKAIQLYEKSYKMYKQLQGQQSINAASVLNNIGLVFKRIGNYTKALQYYNKSLEIKQKKYGKEHFETTYSLDSIANIYVSKGSYDQALQLFYKILQIKQKHFGTKQNLEIASTFYNIGSAYDDKGSFEKALQYYNKCKAIRQKVVGKQNLDYSSVLNNIALTYKGLKDYPTALQIMNECYQVQRKVLGQNHISHATTFCNMGLIYNQMGQYDKAIQKYKKTQAIEQKILGTQNIDIATTYNNIGLAYKKKGDFVNGQIYYTKCLNIRLKILGKQGVDVATIYHNLGLLYIAMNNITKADEYVNIAYNQRLKILGPNHHSTKLTQNELKKIKQRIEKQKANPVQNPLPAV